MPCMEVQQYSTHAMHGGTAVQHMLCMEDRTLCVYGGCSTPALNTRSPCSCEQQLACQHPLFCNASWISQVQQYGQLDRAHLIFWCCPDPCCSDPLLF